MAACLQGKARSHTSQHKTAGFRGPGKVPPEAPCPQTMLAKQKKPNSHFQNLQDAPYFIVYFTLMKQNI